VITIRSITDDDWGQWRAVRLSALADAPYAFSSTLADWTGAQDSEQRWRDRLTAVPFNLLAFLDGRAVGMASATEPSGDVVELISMWVSPTARGMGAGDALIGEIAAWAYRQGASLLVLHVRPDNFRATALYSRNGFVDAGRSTRSIEGPPELQMVKQLEQLP
jgi:ribosomal protein S18 acetylase RimI-like enzyme